MPPVKPDNTQTAQTDADLRSSLNGKSDRPVHWNNGTAVLQPG